MSTDTKQTEAAATEPAQPTWPRQLTSHKTSGLNEALKISVMDEPGPGGANHLYTIYADETKPAIEGEPPPQPNVTVHLHVQFQKGPIAEAGVNGITIEALLAIVEDRLVGFQSGDFKCDENAAALAGVQSSLAALKSRTAKRVERGVEGTSQK